jgi:hypothetical protein
MAYYPLALLRAAFRGMDRDEALRVTFVHDNRQMIGTVNGIGSKLGISVDDTPGVGSRLVEDVHAYQVIAADIQPPATTTAQR